jgi:outer membrane protein TolC
MRPAAITLILLSSLMLNAEVTLKQAIENGLNLSAAVANQLLEERGAELDQESAARQKLFQANAGGSYRYTSDRMEISAGPMQMAGLRGNWDMKLGLTQPLYTGGLLANAEKLQAFRRQAEAHTLEWRRVELAGRIKTSYFTLQLLRSKKQSLQLLLDSLNLHLEKLEKFFREELVRRSDVLETRLKVDETRLALADLEQQIESEQIAFRTLCGYDADQIENNYHEAGLTLDEARSRFETANPLLRALAGRKQMAGAQKRLASASTRPQVAGFAELHYARPGVNYFSKEWSFYLQTGISVSFPVFNWNKAGRERQQADLAAARVENQAGDLRRETDKGLQQLESARRAAEAKLQVTDALVAAAAENAGLKEKLYAENQSDNLDYLEAMTAWERYRSQRQELLARLELIKVNVHTLVGIMGE